jgi:hypothetical protein
MKEHEHDGRAAQHVPDGIKRPPAASSGGEGPDWGRAADLRGALERAGPSRFCHGDRRLGRKGRCGARDRPRLQLDREFLIVSSYLPIIRMVNEPGTGVP